MEENPTCYGSGEAAGSGSPNIEGYGYGHGDTLSSGYNRKTGSGTGKGMGDGPGIDGCGYQEEESQIYKDQLFIGSHFKDNTFVKVNLNSSFSNPQVSLFNV